MLTVLFVFLTIIPGYLVADSFEYKEGRIKYVKNGKEYRKHKKTAEKRLESMKKYCIIKKL